ncbi:enoyl-CoA-hydratase DpgB [Bradyrhizobium oligotrophicum]|uniref:enoyl-CoA-hydratase DpgB n=1 Tax=Bradyrhizobium oligotrophicum TaxID=44255 RepID=UPI003EBC2DAF
MTILNHTSSIVDSNGIARLEQEASTAASVKVLEVSISLEAPLSEIVSKLSDLPSVVADSAIDRVVLIRLSGATERASPGARTTQEVNHWERAVRRLERLQAATVVDLAGHCGGAALDLILACDYRVATADFMLGLPIRDGRFWPGMTLYRLVQQIGLAATRRLLFAHDVLSVEQCTRIGLVDSAAGWQPGLISAIRRGATTDLSVRRRLLAEALSTSYEDALGTHLAACDRELRRTSEASDDRH